MIIQRAFTESLHPRGTGAVGGQFVAAGAASSKTAPAGGKVAAGKGTLAFNGKTGPGYGRPGGDPRVHKLQAALNKLGLTDSAGKKLQVDGKLGPKTTAAIKKAQKALGLKPDGVVTASLLRKLTSAKSAKDLKAPAKKTATPAKKTGQPAKKVAPAAKKTATPAKKTGQPAKKVAPAAKKATTNGRGVPPVLAAKKG